MSRLVLSLLAFAGAMLALAAPARAQAWCTPGARVAAASYGHWYKATVLKSDGAKCWVHYDKFSSSSDEAVTRDNLGAITLADQYDTPGAATAASAPTRAAAARRPRSGCSRPPTPARASWGRSRAAAT